LLVLAQGAAQAPAEAAPEQWPYPCPFDAWLKVADAIIATPGMSANTIQKVARVKREHVSLALIKGEGPFFTNTGTKSSPRWEWGGGFTDWCEKQVPDGGSGSS
jgi:hypothetical protein